MLYGHADKKMADRAMACVERELKRNFRLRD
jgi:hypothetical protein